MKSHGTEETPWERDDLYRVERCNVMENRWVVVEQGNKKHREGWLASLSAGEITAIIRHI